MVEQTILVASSQYEEMDGFFQKSNSKRVLLVCGRSISRLRIDGYFLALEKRLGVRVTRFSDFLPNPCYTSVVKGIALFKKEECDAIVAVGGGSAMDVAKCIKLFSNMEMNTNYLQQEIIPNDIAFMAVPTTAGSGSEATRFAVIYHNNEKQSISHESCRPSIVLLDSSTLDTLPEYQKKATMMDAFCQAVESFWSVNSTSESKELAKEVIWRVLANKDGYLANDKQGNANMLIAANLSGKAINITQTTAGHAMCYKLAGLYGLAHGHAVALIISKLWPYMTEHMDRCVDPRGVDYLYTVFTDIAQAMGCTTVDKAIQSYQTLLESLNFPGFTVENENQIDLLTKSVNPVRLQNHPIALDEDAFRELYRQIIEDYINEGYTHES